MILLVVNFLNKSYYNKYKKCKLKLIDWLLNKLMQLLNFKKCKKLIIAN